MPKKLSSSSISVISAVRTGTHSHFMLEKSVIDSLRSPLSIAFYTTMERLSQGGVAHTFQCIYKILNLTPAEVDIVYEELITANILKRI